MLRVSGSVERRKDGSWWARVVWKDPQTRRRREARRLAQNKSDAKRRLQRLTREIQDGSGRALPVVTFHDLAEHFLREYAKAPEIIQGRKVSGMKSWKTARAHVAGLRAYFGHRPLESITYDDIRRFKLARLKEPYKRSDDGPSFERSIANVNRCLSVLRRMLNVAVRQRWMQSNPFSHGEPLISAADESPREQTLTRDEETRLLAACSGKRRQHLRPIIIAAIETGARQGELFKLRWKDVDRRARRISILSTNTKTQRARQVPITTRLDEELSRLEAEGVRPDDFVFGGITTIKNSFTGACRDAGLEGFVFHSLRHVAATRMIAAGLSLPETAKILGHSTSEAVMTWRYINVDDAILDRAVSLLNQSSQAAMAPTLE